MASANDEPTTMNIDTNDATLPTADDDDMQARSIADSDSFADNDSGYWAIASTTHSVSSSIYDYEQGKSPQQTILPQLEYQG
jgi:hypothetical protein